MKPEEFQVGTKFRYIGNQGLSPSDIVQTVLAVKGKYGEVRTDHPELHPDRFFDHDSKYAKDCILISQPDNYLS